MRMKLSLIQWTELDMISPSRCLWVGSGSDVRVIQILWVIIIKRGDGKQINVGSLEISQLNLFLTFIVPSHLTGVTENLWGYLLTL